MNRFRDYWQSREPREQALLAAAGVLLVLLLLYGAWAPLAHQRDKLERQLPTLQHDVSRVKHIAASLKQPQMGAVGGSQDWRQSAQTWVSSHGWGADRAKLLPDADASIQHWQLTAVSASDFWAWLANLYSTAGVRVRQISVKQAGTGQVSADVELNHP